MDLKCGRSQKKTKALTPKMMRPPIEIQRKIGVRDKKLKI
jgi:hypothetical protein